MQGVYSLREQIAITRKEIRVAKAWIAAGMPDTQKATNNFYKLHQRLAALQSLRKRERKRLRLLGQKDSQLSLSSEPEVVLEVLIEKVNISRMKADIRAKALLKLHHALSYVRQNA